MNKLDYYTKNILNSINTVESITKCMFHVKYERFNISFNDACDNKDTHSLMRLNESLNKEIDRLRSI